MPFEKILENGIVYYKNNYVKIVKVTPINYDLKSNLEKEAILNSYKLFLKTCDFNIQILIQSKKENLSRHISKIKNTNEQNKKIEEFAQAYINFIMQKNEENKSSSKNFYILLKHTIDNFKQNADEETNSIQIAMNNLSEKYFKIKESLSRCGNTIYEINSKEEVESILISFYNFKTNMKD